MTVTVPAPGQFEGQSLGQAALLWAQSGWDVFPVVPRGKTPYAMGEFCARTDDHSCGFHCATNDATMLGLWWSLHPDSNIGLSSNEAFVVDEDRLGALTEAGVKLPRCPYQVTGRLGGGRHFFLRAPEGWAGLEGEQVRVTPRLPAVEVKGFGKGYVVAAPSIHASGAAYGVALGGYVPEVPEAVIKKLVDVERMGGTRPFIVIGAGGFEIPAKVAEGGRYEAIRSYVAHLYNRGFAPDEMWAQVKLNLAPAFNPKLTDRELRERFERATAGMERRLGERKALPAGAVVAPLLLEDAPLTEYDSTPVEWTWQSWLPKGVVTVMDGNPGVSKSTLVADLVARLTRGGEWPDGQAIDAPARTLWVTTEDDPGRVLRPRIEAAGGDPSMVLFVKSEVVFPAARTAFLELLVRRASEPLGLGLVVLDPLFSHIEASVRTIADAEMRRGVMNPLNEAAEAARTALLVVRHFSKDTTASAVNRGAGSLGGIVGAARALWTVTADPDDETGETKAVGVSKLNYAPAPPALRYAVVSKLPPGWVTGSVSGIEWLGAAPVSITEILMETPSSRDAQPVLAGLLAGGPKPAEAIYAQMKARGFGRQAVRAAKSRLGVLVTKTSMRGGWEWSMPDSEESALGPEEAEGSEGAGAAPSRSFGDSSASRARARRDPPYDSSDPSHTHGTIYVMDPSDSEAVTPLAEETGYEVGKGAAKRGKGPKNPKKLVEGRFPRAGAPTREGRCPVCSRLISLAATGVLRSHRPGDEMSDAAWDKGRCVGSGQEPAIDLVAPVIGEWAIEPCRDYTNHQSSHRRTDAGWICNVCTPEGGAA